MSYAPRKSFRMLVPESHASWDLPEGQRREDVQEYVKLRAGKLSPVCHQLEKAMSRNVSLVDVYFDAENCLLSWGERLTTSVSGKKLGPEDRIYENVVHADVTVEGNFAGGRIQEVTGVDTRRELYRQGCIVEESGGWAPPGYIGFQECPIRNELQVERLASTLTRKAR